MSNLRYRAIAAFELKNPSLEYRVFGVESAIEQMNGVCDRQPTLQPKLY
ncbi:MAG TPA: hypothetical protein V6C63_03080 [Allocoleopsis sp.]